MMPCPTFPPTPQPSTDITAKSSTNAPYLDTNFDLPPAALTGRDTLASSSGSSEIASDSSYRPRSPSSPVAISKLSNSRKRPGTACEKSTVNRDDYHLPPPPTRSHKIIEMKPKDTKRLSESQAQIPNAKSAPGAANSSKKKQGGSSTAAGRKMARKTAHSLIERRRRSKMNEEFGVLKDMIPACRGQEMHKLSILQASIEYMRYLEQCLADLKTGHLLRRGSPASIAYELPPPPIRRAVEDDGEEEKNDDEEMEDTIPPAYTEPVSTARQPLFAPTISPSIEPSNKSINSHSAATSPAIMAHNGARFTANLSPAVLPTDTPHYSLASSSARSTVSSSIVYSSPNFSAQAPSITRLTNPSHNLPPNTGLNHTLSPSHGSAHFQLTSPVLSPQTDREDQEATAALLMLNTDRRCWNGARGISVKDLLSG